VTREAYPDLRIPYHSRWRHFVVGGVDRWQELASQLPADPLERARAAIDLATVSVLLDAGAGTAWRYRDAPSALTLARSEGLAIASLAMFQAGEDYASRLDGEANRLIGIIMDNAQKMGRLIDDLLEFSKLGRRELSRGMVPMKQMVDLICKDLLSAETDRHINVELQDIPNAFADTVTIRQVWINLLSNAIKYSRSKSESIITIGGQVQDQEVVYRVSDNGAGFDMRYYDKLFGVFHRLHRESEFEGTGVGLAIVQRIVGKHGGRIWAEGQVNHGATLWFSLPWRRDEPAG
jgi:light-regulated signal transduction histidine kinase (bacteriophytochrome)